MSGWVYSCWMLNQVEGRVKVDNNNTGALDNRAQQMDSGGFTLLVSGYYMDNWTITNIKSHC